MKYKSGDFLRGANNERPCVVKGWNEDLKAYYVVWIDNGDKTFEAERDLEPRAASLKDFPLVAEAFNLIETDSMGFLARNLDLEKEVNPYWLPVFRAAENSLHRCADLKAEVVPELREKKEYKGDTLKEILAIHVNDDHEYVNHHLGIGEMQGWLTEYLFNQFFDGELSQEFYK